MQGMRLLSTGSGTGITLVPHPGATAGRRHLSAAIATGTSRPIAATVDGTQMTASIATAIDTHPGASTAPTAGAMGASRRGHRPSLGHRHRHRSGRGMLARIFPFKLPAVQPPTGPDGQHRRENRGRKEHVPGAGLFLRRDRYPMLCAWRRNCMLHIERLFLPVSGTVRDRHIPRAGKQNGHRSATRGAGARGIRSQAHTPRWAPRQLAVHCARRRKSAACARPRTWKLGRPPPCKRTGAKLRPMYDHQHTAGHLVAYWPDPLLVFPY